MRRAHEFQVIPSSSGQPAPALLSKMPGDCALIPTGRRKEDRARSRYGALWLESGFYSHLEDATGSVTQSATQSPIQSIDPVDCFVALGVIPSSVESSGKTTWRRASRLDSRLESGPESRLESAARAIKSGPAGQVTGQVAEQVTAQLTAQVAASMHDQREMASREVGSRQIPLTLFATHHSPVAALSARPNGGELP